MQVTFTGLEKIGTSINTHIDSLETMTYRLAVKLNNKGTRDLDTYQEVLSSYKGFQEPEFLDMDFSITENKINSKFPYLNVLINGKKVETKEQNIPLFIKLNNLIKRIASGNEKTETSLEYLKSPECKARYYSETYGCKTGQTPLITLKSIHKPQIVQENAKTINNALERVIKYGYTKGIRDKFEGIKSIGGFHYENEFKTVDKVLIDLKDDDMVFFKRFLNYKNPLNVLTENKIMIEAEKVESTQRPNFKLNGIFLSINDANMPVFRKVMNILTGIKNTEKEIPLPKNYLSDDYYNCLELWSQEKKESLKMWNGMTLDQKMENAIDFNMITQDKSAKRIVNNITNMIEKEVYAYYEV